MAKLEKEVELILERASAEAKERRHEYLCLEHILYSILFEEKGTTILRACGANVSRLKIRLEQFFSSNLERMNISLHTPPQTLAVQRVLQRAVLHSEYSSAKTLTVGDLIAALYTEGESHSVYFLLEEGIERLDVLDYISHGPRLEYMEDAEIDELFDEIEGINLDEDDDNDYEDDEEEDSFSKKPKKPQSICEDLTKLARDGKLDPLIGREKELEQLVQILSRRLKNNPLLVGDQGVGKTAIIEGLALKIAEGSVPSNLKESKILSLNLGNLLAGTRYRGDFEQRLKTLIESLKKDPSAILFIDEIHNLVGAGATSGSTLDAANLLKPVLARGELKCIGSTTFEEYKRHFEKDRALSRRFLKVDINEPSVDEAIKILSGLKSQFENFHGIQYTPAAVKAAVKLSVKYIHDRFLPDKAIDLLDEVGARLKLEQEKERSTSSDEAKKVKTISVRARDIESLLSQTRNIPEISISTNENERLKDLEPEIRKFIYGQDQAVESVTKAILRSRAGLGNLKRPVGSFLLVGPTGVGKTELARQLARVLGMKLHKFDMSEYQEKHTISRLIGAPPGYVGHEQGGLLTDAVLKSPMSIILLDEIEKAHHDIYNVLLQIMDDGVLTDGTGRKAHFSECVVVMTSNVGSENVSGVPMGFANTSRGIDTGALEKTFRPEFRNRLDAIIKFKALPIEVVEQVVDKFVSDIDSQLREKKASLTLSSSARRWFAEKGFNPEYGARNVYRLVQKEIKDRLAEEILFGELKGGGEAKVDVRDDSIFFTFTARKTTKRKKKGRLALMAPETDHGAE
ncbi:MAG TPA: ATP-dependent Clp protease ATP-binding subunit ClpA [Oligoflexia bacterium]|nr:ATP-dependent Clp protease ATP-binding subunit ClpA [Oligoflexia bacterium]HMP47997.1 ATP-dependent Clp protease ATP-binding subunit ClpA [Oligoflexia bacterium]